MESNTKKHKLAKITISILLIAALLCLSYFCFEGFILDYMNRPSHRAVYLSEQGCADALGISALDYDSIQNEFGAATASDKVESDFRSGVLILEDHYPSFTAYSTEVNEKDGLSHYTYLIKITDESRRFGWLHIGICSSRALVRLAYLFDETIDAKELAYSAEDYPAVDEGFYGEDWSRILFCYDENDKVESMAYEPPEFY